MSWHNNGNLLCDTCPAKLDVPGPHAAVLMHARVHGWHCYNGETMGGEKVERHLCPDCMGTVRVKLAPRGPMEDDVPLFDVTADIENAIEMRARSKRNRKD